VPTFRKNVDTYWSSCNVSYFGRKQFLKHHCENLRTFLIWIYVCEIPCTSDVFFSMYLPIYIPISFLSLFLPQIFLFSFLSYFVLSSYRLSSTYLRNFWLYLFLFNCSSSLYLPVSFPLSIYLYFFLFPSLRYKL